MSQIGPGVWAVGGVLRFSRLFTLYFDRFCNNNNNGALPVCGTIGQRPQKGCIGCFKENVPENSLTRRELIKADGGGGGGGDGGGGGGSGGGGCGGCSRGEVGAAIAERQRQLMTNDRNDHLRHVNCLIRQHQGGDSLKKTIRRA